ncbi:hypothetical protein AGMMS49545_16920 [Betaproteobacteria bacterium]|nr:hypothetical protein AGMMS49545_16920 [Betaproteobacteria bacterium]GHU48240.1 hypothetical protein AGMMS50289_24570 [Betaproteobacteria bacterium]
MMHTVSSARIEARISPDLHAMIKRAAEIQGRTLSDFVATATQEAARRTIEQNEIIHLTMDDQQRFADALLSPPGPSPALRRAMARHDKILRTT